jgi:hypothetical protein
MIIESAQWNLFSEGSIPPTVSNITSVLQERRPAIITLQGVEFRGKCYNQADQIANALRYEYRQHFALSTAPYQADTKLGIAILSTFPLWFAERIKIGDHQGVLRTKARINSRDRLIVATAHVDPRSGLTEEILQALQLDPKHNPLYLIQGEFNAKQDDKPLLEANDQQLQEVPMPHQLLHGNKNTDHVLFRGIQTDPPSPTDYRPTVVPITTGRNLVITRFVLPDEPKQAPRVRSITPDIFLYRKTK